MVRKCNFLKFFWPTHLTYNIFLAISLIVPRAGGSEIASYNFFTYTILANPEVEPHAPNTYQSKLVPSVAAISVRLYIYMIVMVFTDYL